MDAQIPITLKPFFQEYTFENLDAEKNADLVIERTLAWGGREELRWLFARFRVTQIKDWFHKWSWGRMLKVRLNYWRIVLDVEPIKRGEGIWPH
ncbi:MAG: hypothetical protein HY070_03275 [Chloroflexi bacterium]|nr:hypothetical protein [Chloroflexota bacterium]MBI3740639.1 hypothetical protein [Chloroflexota bacterium]